MQNFLVWQCLVDDVAGFLELSLFTNASFPNIYYLMKWIGDANMKTNFLLNTAYIVFFLNKILMNDLNHWLTSYTCKE